MRLAAVIPAYNEAARIASIVAAVRPYAEQVLVIDDGSVDDTAERAEAAGAVVIRHPLNLGKGAACRSGFYAALKLGAEAIVTLDGDGQHDPAGIPAFVEKARAMGGPGIVVGTRMGNPANMPLLRYATNRLLSLLLSLLARRRISDSQCGFRLIHRRVLETVHYNNNRYDAESEILVRAARAGFLIGEVPVATIYNGGISKIHKLWDTLRFLRFFFRHLLYSPPVAVSREAQIAAELSSATLAGLQARKAGLPADAR